MCAHRRLLSANTSIIDRCQKMSMNPPDEIYRSRERLPDCRQQFDTLLRQLTDILRSVAQPRFLSYPQYSMTSLDLGPKHNVAC
jgi:hypothetical protein